MTLHRSWERTLKEYVSEHPKPTDAMGAEQDADAQLVALVTDMHAESIKRDSTYEHISRFFYKKAAASDSELSQKFRKEARTRFLERRAQDLLEHADLTKFWTLLTENASQVDNRQDRINYDQYSTVGNLLREDGLDRMAQYVKPSVFLKHPRDQLGRVSIESLFQYALTKAHIMTTRLTLSYYDTTGHGFLREVRKRSVPNARFCARSTAR
jgi:hypothetical protein